MDAYEKLLIACQDKTDGIAMENLRIYERAKDEFIKRQIQANLSLKFQLKEISPFCSDLYDERQHLKEKQAARMGTLWLWLTVNPNPNVKFEDFKKKITDAANRKMFNDFLYVFEQRGQHKEEIGKGFHSHLLLKRDMKYKQNKIIKNLKNSFKKITNVENHDIFNFHWCPEEYLDDKRHYILDQNKIGVEKTSKQLMDILFRQNKNLKEYYKWSVEEMPATPVEKGTSLSKSNTDQMQNIN